MRVRRATARDGTLVCVPNTPAPVPSDFGPPTLVPVPDIASALGMIVTRVHQLLRERQLVAFVAVVFVAAVLTSTITLLSDGGFTDPEIIDWLFESEDSLPGRPITALRENRGREVHRRAQVAGY